MRKITCVLAGVLIVASALAGCGKKDNITIDKNEESTWTEINQTQDNNIIKQENTTKRSDDLLGESLEIFNGFESKIPKGYGKTGNAGQVVFNSDKADIYISRGLDSKKKLPLSDITSENIAENISDILWIDNGIAKHVGGYTKDVPVSINSINDTEINGIKMKKFEGKLTLAKDIDKSTTWDCYIYGYIFEASTDTVVYFGIEREQSQPADKIELIKKNMDAIVNTISLF